MSGGFFEDAILTVYQRNICLAEDRFFTIQTPLFRMREEDVIQRRLCVWSGAADRSEAPRCPAVHEASLFSFRVEPDDHRAVTMFAFCNINPQFRRIRKRQLDSVRIRRTCFGSCSFAVAAPTTWNSLPLLIRNSSSISGFCSQLKTFLYKSVFEPL